MMPMTITKTQNAGSITLLLEGRLDTVTAPPLQETRIPLFTDVLHIDR
jgi:anti-anti-sigma regulatory factor